MLLGSENRSTGASGVGKPKHRRALGSILGRFGGILGWLWGVRERSGEAAGGRIFFFISGGLKLWNFVKTLICFWNGWKLIKINFSMDFFLKVDLIGCFRELNVRTFRIFFLIIFTIKKSIFYKKKKKYGIRETGIRGVSWPGIPLSRVRRPGSLEWDGLVSTW